MSTSGESVNPKNETMAKPFQRKEFGQYKFLCFSALAFGAYVGLRKRPTHDLFLSPVIGLSVFTCLRIFWGLKEIICYGNSFSRTIELVIQPSSSQKDQYGFWLRLICLVGGITQLPPVAAWNFQKEDILILLFTIMVGIHYGWHDCSLAEAYRLEKPCSYSGGSAMAYSFYYGYLNLIARGLVQRMETFRDNEGKTDDQMPKKKLYILIPSSSFVFDKLKGYQQCTKTKDLKIEDTGDKFNHHQQDRGLVKNRTYKNTMYMVEYSQNENYYILLEGATPLITYYETCKEHIEFERNKREVVSSFYFTLRELIQGNREMKDVVKLIYYDDESKDVTIPDIVRKRILKKKS